ncbi:hypothetical protein CPC08DRAFT_173640 [Agrocybe pediades]|nr:hypothetical protein CPC08DRAFT_173640 [Agrocybe pediades]
MEIRSTPCLVRARYFLDWQRWNHRFYGVVESWSRFTVIYGRDFVANLTDFRQHSGTIGTSTLLTPSSSLPDLSYHHVSEAYRFNSEGKRNTGRKRRKENHFDMGQQSGRHSAYRVGGIKG